MWIKLHFYGEEGTEIIYIQVANICTIFTGNDGKTHISFVGSDTNWIMVEESVDTVKELLGIIERTEEEKN